MLAQSYSPSELSRQDLDSYLEAGWFRQGQTIFTTNFLKYKGVFHSAIWLRIDLRTYCLSKTHRKLQKLNAKFNVKYRPLVLSDVHENLFANYKTGITFDAASSLHDLLSYDSEYDIYNTQEVCIYDGEKLIASGFFDVGEKTTMGITCFYNPDYQKYSLGKYLMFLKIEYAQKQGMDYFYPGYFAPNYPLFDYKLDLAKPYTEYLELSSNTWKSIREYSYETVPIEVMLLKLRNLQDFLEARGVQSKVYEYEFFDADLIPLFNGLQSFDFPVFLQCFENYGNIKNNPIIVYDVQDAKFHLIICEGIYNVTFTPNHSQHFTSQVLQMVHHLFETELAEVMSIVVSTSFVLVDEQRRINNFL